MTRREAIGIAMGVSARVASIRAGPNSGDHFWEEKPPSEWTHDEIKQLTTKSPWACSPEVRAVRDETDRPFSERSPLDFQRVDKARGIVGRWESARVMQDALHGTDTDVTRRYYVINLPGDTWITRALRDRNKLPDRLREIQHYTKLGLQDRSISIDHAEDVSTGPSHGILLCFPRRAITREDDEIQFVMVIDSFRLDIRFRTKDMLYHGELDL
jgi:hypothetical protein